MLQGTNQLATLVRHNYKCASFIAAVTMQPRYRQRVARDSPSKFRMFWHLRASGPKSRCFPCVDSRKSKWVTRWGHFRPRPFRPIVSRWRGHRGKRGFIRRIMNGNASLKCFELGYIQWDARRELVRSKHRQNCVQSHRRNDNVLSHLTISCYFPYMYSFVTNAVHAGFFGLPFSVIF